MELSHFWEASRPTASQETLPLLWNPRFHYRTHKISPPIPILIQINLAHAPHPTSCRSILILSFHLHLCLASGLFTSGLPTKTLYTSLPRTCYMPHPSRSSLFDHPNDIWWKVQTIKFLVLQSYSLFGYVVPVRPKYLPQHPILDQPQLTFLPHCESPSFTLMQNNRQNYISVYFSVNIFG